MPQNYLKGSEYLHWVKKGAKSAKKNATTEYERIFCETFETDLGTRLKNAIAPGDKRVIEQPLSNALVEGISSAGSNWKVSKSYSLDLPRAPWARKEIDVAVEHQEKLYLIEQKTILNFNSLGEVAFEGWCLKKGLRWRREPYRFVGFFHHIYGVDAEKILALAEEARSDGFLDAIFVLRQEGVRRNSWAFKPLISDIKDFFQQG